MSKLGDNSSHCLNDNCVGRKSEEDNVLCAMSVQLDLLLGECSSTTVVGLCEQTLVRAVRQ